MLPHILLTLYASSVASTTVSAGQLTYSNASNAPFLWGPYRPNLYLGIRPRIPKSLLMGLMWSNADDASGIPRNLRHTCEQDEGMAGYGWTTYDVRKGGTQIINDTGNSIDLFTDFAKAVGDRPDGDWGLRVMGVPRADARDQQATTLIFYLGNEAPDQMITCRNGHKIDQSGSEVVCDGTMDGFGNFTIDFPADSNAPHKASVKSLTVATDTIWQAKAILSDQLKNSDSPEGVIADNPGKGNLHFVQKTFGGGFQFDILFSSDLTPKGMTSEGLTSWIQDASTDFRERFDLIYAPQAPFHDEQHIKFSQSLLSNLMGGIGYFDGTSKVDVSSAPEYAETGQDFWAKASSAQEHAVFEEQGPYQLFSAVPSRPFFPRGFLWDEGFHLQVILDWDMDLALEMLSSWFNLMDEHGWIAREQILGREARSKVPSEFQTQYPHYANPPTLFLVVEALIARLDGEVSYLGAPSRHLSEPAVGKTFLEAIYPKMKKHYDWFCRTQAGNLTTYQIHVPGISRGYRWRGRTPQHILTSGLDDYPRAQSPHPEELHLDALCWVGSMAMSLKQVSSFLGKKEDQETFSKHRDDVVQSLDSIHWSVADKAYCDTTVVDGKRLEKVCHRGYISLFPFLLNLLNPNHPHIEAVLQMIQDPEELWSSYGIRSLSTKDEYYGTQENYWRSPVWININYLMLQRLLELAQQPGPYHQKAHEMYINLRLNLVNTVFESWKHTGFAWEQYNADTGKGQRTQHFTGWTSLVVRIMAMPDLRSASQPQMARYNDHLKDRVGGDMKLILMVMGLLLVCLLFRKRLTRAGKGII